MVTKSKTVGLENTLLNKRSCLPALLLNKCSRLTAYCLSNLAKPKTINRQVCQQQGEIYIAYIPLRRVGQYPQLESFAMGIPTCWYLETLKFVLPPTPTLKFELPPTQTPNANRLNIGRVGSPTQNSHIGPCMFHVVCVSFTCVGWPTRKQFPVEYGLIDKE